MKAGRGHVLAIGALLIVVGTAYINLATYGTYRFLEPELLGTVFDAQAQSFLEGRVDVERRYVGWEYYEVNGLTYIYWGPWPALLRIPVLSLWPSTFGLWARWSCFAAAATTALGWGAAINGALRGRHAGLFLLATLAAALGTPVVWLLSSSVVYHEPILWGMAGSAWCLWASLEFERRRSTTLALVFSVAFAVAYLSRSTYAFPWAIAALRPAYLIATDPAKTAADRRRALSALLLPMIAAICAQGFLNYVKFGGPFTFIDLRAYNLAADPERMAALERYGYSHLARLPDAFRAYYLPHAQYFSSRFPFIRTAVVDIAKPETMFLAPDHTIALTVSSPWLLPFFALGLWRLGRRHPPGESIVVGSLFLQAVVSLTLWIVVLRYLVEALPFFIALTVVALGDDRGSSGRVWESRLFQVALTCLCAFSIYASMASAISWNAELNMGSPPGYRAQMQHHFEAIDRHLAALRGSR